jgi:hypothetical protein
LLFGDKNLRDEFKKEITDLTGIAPAIEKFLSL